jgi:hypothetical protein
MIALVGRIVKFELESYVRKSDAAILIGELKEYWKMSLNQSLQDLNTAFPDSDVTMPVLFVGHGSPMNALEDNDFSRIRL